MEYRHTQIGTMIIAGFGVAIAVIIGQLFIPNIPHIPMIVVGVFLLFILLLFSSLTVEVKQGSVFVRFGPGIIRREIRLSDITDAQPVKNPWFVGWGIRWVPGQFVLWNVGGLRAVELKLRDGKRFRIGTDDPEALAGAIQHNRLVYR
jgi:hypothetical protein